jgi:hypothetical protein
VINSPRQALDKHTVQQDNSKNTAAVFMHKT